MNSFRLAVAVGVSLAMAACGGGSHGSNGRSLAVAAAANLTGVMDEIAAAFEKESRVHVVLSYGSTAQLSQQIENGAPFDVFAAADTEHVDALVKRGRLRADSRAVYARGQLALWVPAGRQVRVQRVEDLTAPEVRYIAVAQPELAPYGRAAVEVLKAAGIWDKVQPKVVYANNINMARQFAESGNADAAFTAFSLVIDAKGTVIKPDPKLYRPIDQALGIVESTRELDVAREFVRFLSGGGGRAILARRGYFVE